MAHMQNIEVSTHIVIPRSPASGFAEKDFINVRLTKFRLLLLPEASNQLSMVVFLYLFFRSFNNTL